MKLFSRLTYNEYITIGEVEERLPRYKKNLSEVYPLDKTIDNVFPTLEIKAINNTPTIVYGKGDLVKRISNVSVENGLMKFNGNANSFIELNKTLFDENSIEIEIKFKVNNFLKNKSLLTARNNNKIDLSFVIDKDKRMIYSEMQELSGIYNTQPDLDESGIYSLSDSGAINNNIWYTLKFIKYKGIIVCYLNDMKTNALIGQGTMNCDSLYIGQKSNLSNSFDPNYSFDGWIEYIKIKKLESFPKTERHSLHTDSLKDDFTITYEWTPELLGTYDIINLGSLKVKSEHNTIKIFNGTTLITSKEILEKRTYFISHSYKRSNNKMKIFIYNKTNHKILFNEERDISIPSNQNIIDVVLNKNLFLLSIYKEALKDEIVLGNCAKKLSLTKEGELNIELEEEGTFKLRNDNGTKYHFKLGYDLNSDCKTIKSNDKVFSTEGGIKSGLYRGEKVIDLIPAPEDAKLVDYNWNKNLHHKAYEMHNWTSGYNSGVEEPTIGYHAKWIREGKNQNQIMLRFVNCNQEFNHTNRWLGSCRYIASSTLWTNCKPGDKIGIAFKARADRKANIQVGMYRYAKSTGQTSFYNNLKDITIKDSNWTNYWYEGTIDQDWDLTKDVNIYFYGNFTNNATIDIETISLTKNGHETTYDVMTDNEDRKIKLSFSKAINLDYSKNWHIIYQTKIYDLSNNSHIDSLGQQIYWGIENNKFIFNCGSTKLSYDEIDTKKIMNQWITISLSHIGDKTRLTIYTRQGIYLREVTGNLPTSLFNSSFDYDLMLGGKDNLTTGCGIYKDLTLIKGWYIGNNYVENMFRTKLSYYNNKLLSNVNISESNI